MGPSKSNKEELIVAEVYPDRNRYLERLRKRIKESGEAMRDKRRKLDLKNSGKGLDVIKGDIEQTSKDPIQEGTSSTANELAAKWTRVEGYTSSHLRREKKQPLPCVAVTPRIQGKGQQNSSKRGCNLEAPIADIHGYKYQKEGNAIHP